MFALNTNRISTVNFHLWQPCNMGCNFCFATFHDVKKDMKLPKGHVPEQEATEIVHQLAEFGFKKINFAGGEPTLCPWLPILIERAKKPGMQTSIVTNGSRISDEWLGTLSGNLDIIALSIDSANTATLERLGRNVRGKPPITEDEYLHIIGLIKRHGIRLKINTVVTLLNWQEDLTGFIRSAGPERWKLLQVLPIEGQNDDHFANLQITASQFYQYVQRNGVVETDGITVVAESNELMTKSYVMVDPAGRFFDNAKGTYTYSEPILKVGVEEALRQVSTDFQRFKERGGQYE
ncbi:MAG: viperin family antiviral radical SAM protein [Candidatus Poribacteria bacterium]|nr:viperin family antiviral radical SAM protein [Candidatus Poribacteria bacterium]